MVICIDCEIVFLPHKEQLFNLWQYVVRKQIGFEQHFERTHLPQSVVVYGISDMGIPTGDAHITRDLGMGMPKTRGCPNHCDTVGKKARRGWDVYPQQRDHNTVTHNTVNHNTVNHNTVNHNSVTTTQ